MRDSLECPNCQRKLTAPADDTVESVTCPGCGANFRPNAPAPLPEHPVVVALGCPACGRNMEIRTDLVDSWERCPHCSARFYGPELLAIASRSGELPPSQPLLPVTEEQQSSMSTLPSAPETPPGEAGKDEWQTQDPVASIAFRVSVEQHRPQARTTRLFQRLFLIGAAIPLILMCFMLLGGIFFDRALLHPACLMIPTAPLAGIALAIVGVMFIESSRTLYYRLYKGKKKPDVDPNMAKKKTHGMLDKLTEVSAGPNETENPKGEFSSPGEQSRDIKPPSPHRPPDNSDSYGDTPHA